LGDKILEKLKVYLDTSVPNAYFDSKNPVRQEITKQFWRKLKELTTKSEEIRVLAEEYVTRGIIPAKYIEDAVHISLVTVNSIDILVSWNFEHIVKLKTKREVNAVNILLGYPQIEIIEPAML